MRTYSDYLSQYLNITNDPSAENTALAPILINDSIRTVCNIQGGKLRFLEATEDMTTVADQEAYYIPNKFRKLIDMYVYSGVGTSTDTIYMPEMVFDPTKWKLIKAYRLGTQDVPYFTYVENQQFRIQPIPSTTGNKITLRGRLNIKDLSIADYTTGSIVSIANAGTAVIGTGTTWTQDMIGRYIRITETSAANGGDGFWYQIGGWTDATHISLLKPYGGTSITAGTASYTIGQCSAIPEAYDVSPLYRAIALYYQKQDPTLSKSFWSQYDGGMEAGYSKEYGGVILQMIDNEGETEEGAYIPPFASGSNTVMTAPYYFPYQLASGF